MVFCLKWPMEIYPQTSRSKSMRMVLNLVMALKSSAMESCGSIWVVYGFQVRPRLSTNSWLNYFQSTLG